MMFIYFLEQVWTVSIIEIHNFETDEIGRCYSGKYYPTKWMEEGVDWIDY